MKKYILLFITFLSVALVRVNAQVGATTNAPSRSAALDIKATNKGLLIPRISLQSLTDKTTIAGGNPAIGLRVYNTNSALVEGEGHYYWDGTQWKKMATADNLTGNAWSLNGNTGTSSANYLGTSDAVALQIRANAQPSITIAANGNVALAGNTNPDNAAILDASYATKRAITMPKVALTGANDITTVPNPQKGMMVYNTNSDHVDVFNGSEWTELVNSASNLVTPQLMAQAKSLNAGNLTTNYVWYDTKLFDPENAMNVGTSSIDKMTYTVKQAGKHQIYVNYTATNCSNVPWYLQIRKNGAVIAEQDSNPTNSTGSSFAFAIDDFVPGDIITVYKGGSGTGWSANLSSVAVFRFQ